MGPAEIIEFSKRERIRLDPLLNPGTDPSRIWNLKISTRLPPIVKLISAKTRDWKYE